MVGGFKPQCSVGNSRVSFGEGGIGKEKGKLCKVTNTQGENVDVRAR